MPLPPPLLEALVSVDVIVDDAEPSTFSFTFDLPRQSPLWTFFLLGSGAQVPLFRVIVTVMHGLMPVVLIDGVVTDHRVEQGSGGKGMLVVTGVDLTTVMHRIDRTGFQFPNVPAHVRVMTILAQYAAFGIIPMVIPSPFVDVPMVTDYVPVQRGSDLTYIRSLAEEVGHVFYLKAGPAPGMSIAYWGPPTKVGVPQPALTTDMPPFTNVQSLAFDINTEAKTMPLITIQDPTSKASIPIPIPDINPLQPPLGMLPILGTMVRMRNDLSNASPVKAIAGGVASQARSADAISARGSVAMDKYGHVLHARGLVGVRGAGLALDGLYYVKRVKHTLSTGSYKQDFTLTRNAFVSTLPMLPV